MNVTQLGFVGEEPHLLNALAIQGKVERLVLKVENVDIEDVIALGGNTPVMWRNDAASRAIDALAVLPHPFAQLVKAFKHWAGAATGAWCC